EILKKEKPPSGVIHCFTSGDRLADVALELGFAISFSGIVTFPNAKALVEIARRVPAERILVETDCPYLAPVPHRGKRNEPGFVREVAEALARARGEPLEAVGQRTTENARRLFGPRLASTL